MSPEVRQFAEAMQRKLDQNAHKGTWTDTAASYLLRRLDEEVVELHAALRSGTPAEVLEEAADVGNYAMMLADIFGCLKRSGSRSAT